MATRKISDLTKDAKNFNQHTEEGMEMLRKSLKNLGAGRSILIDKNDNIIAGNGVCEAAEALGMDNVVVVETDGKKIVAVKRTDIDLDTKEGRELALADNAVAKANLCWNEKEIRDAQAEYGIQPQQWGVIEFVQEPQEDEGLPEELLGTDLTADEIDAITGDGSTDYQRVVIKYAPADAPWLAELLGLENIEKVVYNIDELQVAI